ncbi:DNA repair protein radC homolog, associated with replication fork [Cupriavidus taiwanensis]|uniref:DNA repair protein radC homolog, associated with replication fork n=1 Tax=Cupriavidus taiwanensis TaxID=164546 RepID=A0A375BP20_9BURK|nr:DNA repair protein RadC [Cupriavidus taiwanensis]SOY49280.1 DNA repair protein radC homolog, associated with replication fork [Cupriavidus taiwanensis]
MTIAKWPACERPREKLLESGAAALSDAELLAVLLRVGAAGKSAVDLARELLHRFGSLTALFAAEGNALAGVRGMGTAKFAQLQAIPELARRALAESLRLPAGFNSPESVRSYLRLTLASLQHEVFLCLFLDPGNRMLASEELFRGTLTRTSVYPREVARHALAHNAAGIIVAHNHPRGTTEPSQSDIHLTRELARTLDLIDVRLLDHFIVAGHEIRSLAESCERLPGL